MAYIQQYAIITLFVALSAMFVSDWVSGLTLDAAASINMELNK